MGQTHPQNQIPTLWTTPPGRKQPWRSSAAARHELAGYRVVTLGSRCPPPKPARRLRPTAPPDQSNRPVAKSYPTRPSTRSVTTPGSASVEVETLAAFLKSGPQYPNHLADTYTDISKSVHSIIPSSQDATPSYQQVCKSFVDNVIRVRGMPTRTISGGDEQQSQNISSSGSHVAKIFDTLLPSITEQLERCVENFRSQADSYLNDQIGLFQAMLRELLDQVPLEGTKYKAIKGRISEVKK